MIDRNNHTTISEGSMPNWHEQLECRRVFTRRNTKCPDINKAWEDFSKKQDISDKKCAIQESTRITIWHPNIKWFVAACSFIIILLTVTFFCFSTKNKLQVCEATHEPKGITMTDTNGNQQTLTTTNRIDFNKMPNKTSNTTAIKNITIKTSRGKDCHIILPDGSEVWLNAESSLEFPKQFIGQTRELQLQGEAYFNVKHDKKHPFVVSSQFLSTAVYGTEFNMNVRESSTANVILIKGCVEVRETEQPQKSIKLYPGSQAMLSEEGLTKKEINPYPFIQWKDGFFYFDNEPLANIMCQLGKWYDTNVVFTDAKLMQMRLHFVADRSNELKDIVESINKMKIVNLVLKEHSIIVKKHE